MASTISALDTPVDVTLGTTTLQVNLPASATRWSVSCGADVLWYPTGTDGGSVNASAETPPLASGAIVELTAPAPRLPARQPERACSLLVGRFWVGDGNGHREGWTVSIRFLAGQVKAENRS